MKTLSSDQLKESFKPILDEAIKTDLKSEDSVVRYGAMVAKEVVVTQKNKRNKEALNEALAAYEELNERKNS